MSTHSPQHLRRRSSVLRRPGIRLGRPAVALGTGAALSVPASLAGGMLAPSADATPGTPAPGATANATTAGAPTANPSVRVVYLRHGSTGELVKVLQQRLHMERDGVFGPLTLAAVKAFQREKAIEVDGIVGPVTWGALGGFPGDGEGVVEPPPQQTGCTSYVVRYGSKGEVVKAAQDRLGIQEDGEFGPRTLNGVRQYQRDNKLEVDGIIGPLTWKALGGYPCDLDPPVTPIDPPPYEPPTPPTTGGQVTGQDVLNTAKKYIGIPYVYGGSTTAGFDCSGLTQYVYRELGINIPRTSRAQSEFRPGLLSPNVEDLKVGDLLFFHSPVSHVGIYAGNGQMLDASRPGTTISIHKLWVKPVKAIRLV